MKSRVYFLKPLAAASSKISWDPALSFQPTNSIDKIVIVESVLYQDPVGNSIPDNSIRN